jgi:two-component system response regulator ResD
MCVGVESTDDAVRCLGQTSVDLVVLDFGSTSRFARDLPDRFIKVLPHHTRLLLLADRKDDPRVLTALERYADDFVIRPISVPELLARGRALIRRTRIGQRRTPMLVTHDGLTLDPTRRRVDVDGAEVKLTDQEFRFLFMFASRPGVVFTRQEIHDIIWSGGTYVTARCVDALVKRVRRRLESVSSDGVRLRTVRGVGYKFVGRDQKQ